MTSNLLKEILNKLIILLYQYIFIKTKRKKIGKIVIKNHMNTKELIHFFFDKKKP